MLKFIKKQKPITLIGVLLLILFIMTLEITGVRAYLFDGDWANNRSCFKVVVNIKYRKSSRNARFFYILVI